MERIFYNRHEVRQMLGGISESTLKKRIKEGVLPPMERIGGVGRRTGYSVRTVEMLKKNLKIK